VLHGVAGIAGAPVTVQHTDGTVEEATFPELIKPSQPFFDIHALTHTVAPGLKVTCTMEGDAFEMEDQRNWTDASFKTYIRPLSKPYPYTLAADETVEQRVALTVDGPLPAQSDEAAPVKVTLGDAPVGTLPELGLAVAPDLAEAALSSADPIRRAGVGHLTCSFDAGTHGATEMQRFKALGAATGADLVLEAILPLRDAAGTFTDDPAVLAADVADVAAAAEGVPFARVVASPACYLKSYQPDAEWPAAPDLGAVYAAVRDAFPGAAIGGGMHAYFTELNRKRPPADAIDFVTHTTCPIVHAADDLSVMETLEALPSVVQSARAIGSGKATWIGPTAIGMRFNPYGAAPMPNPDNRRGAMVERDPRQRGLFNAAWTLAYIAHAARNGVAGVCLSAPVGAFGIAWQAMNWPQPWFDDQPGTPVFPVFHAIAELAPVAGQPASATSSRPGAVAALAANKRLWLANLTAEVQQVTFDRVAATQMCMLDAETFATACAGPEGFEATRRPATLPALTLAPYALCRLDLPG